MAALKNPKHEAVVQHYIAQKERIGWKSYQAIYTSTKQSAAGAAWSRLLKGVSFATRLAELEQFSLDRVIEKTAITPARVLAELGKLGFSNISDYVTIGADGLPFVDMSKATRDHMAAVQEIHCEQSSRTETNADGETEAVPVRKVRFKLADKRQALETIGRHLGMFKDTLELNVKGKVRFVLEGAPKMKTIEAVAEDAA